MQINLLEYLEETVKRLPDKVAFADDGMSFTFDEVYRFSRSVGSFICNKDIRKRPVAVFMEKSPAMAAAFFGVMYGGCFYVPLDAEMPAFRLSLIFETAEPALIICDEAAMKIVCELGYGDIAVSYVDAFKTEINEALLKDIRDKSVDVDPVYVVFTSGSTGVPKGVIASHRSVIDYIENLTEVLNISEETVFGNQVPLYVDACLKELYPTLKRGATTYFIPKSLFMFPVKLIEYLNSHEVNTICWVVSALTIVSGFGALSKVKPETLRTVAFGSEVFPPRQFNKWKEALPAARFVHLYGPTEATGMSAWYEADKPVEPDAVIPIGKPFKNTEIILLDEENKTPEDGRPGEICIRGAGLSLGYMGDSEKTRTVFVQNPLSSFPDIIYRTGDIGLRLPDGNFVFISRKDHQIKHMGHRIELAEIEWAVSRFEGVRAACCVFDAEKSRIILYYCPEDGVSEPDVSDYCKKTLPRYMSPFKLIPTENIPLTPNGKMDRVGLLNMYKGK